MLPISFNSEALSEYVDAIDYFARKSKTLANRFEHIIDELLIQIQKTPERYAIRRRNTRFAISKVYRFVVYFRVESNTLYKYWPLFIRGAITEDCGNANDLFNR